MFREVKRGKLARDILNNITQSLKEGMEEKKKQEEFDKLPIEEKNKVFRFRVSFKSSVKINPPVP